MAQRQVRTLSKRIVDGLSVNGKDAIFWDRDLLGFGVRVYPSGKKVFVVQTRAFGRSKRVTLGEHGNPLTADQARKDAADVIARIKTGQPAVANRKIPGSFRALSRAPTWQTSTGRGRASAPRPDCTTCASTIFDIPSPRERSRLARDCRSSVGCSVTAGWRRPRATRISRAPL